MADPHILRAEQDRHGWTYWHIDCPDPTSPERQCRMGAEPDSPCLWSHWEHHSHHPDCEGYEFCSNRTVMGNEPWHCWTLHGGEPEMCDGWDHDDIGHLHLTDGCYAQHVLAEVGFDEGVVWKMPKDHEQPSSFRVSLNLPMPVWVDYNRDVGFGITLEPVAEWHRVEGRIATVMMSKGDDLDQEAMQALAQMLNLAGATGVVFLRDGSTFETMPEDELILLLDALRDGE